MNSGSDEVLVLSGTLSVVGRGTGSIHKIYRTGDMQKAVLELAKGELLYRNTPILHL